MTDLVSEADRAVEVLIRDALTAAFPEDAQLGEEHGEAPAPPAWPGSSTRSTAPRPI
ncbi:MAG: hypothetical protein R3D61_15320 [Defluviimonas denitrificans]